MAFDFLGLGSVISPVVGGLFNAFSGESANETNIELQRQQQLWNEKMWQMNNEYNTPANQIARLKEAGLNPNLMYGQGTVGNSSSPAQGVSPAHVQPVNYLQGLVGLPDTMLKMAQTRLIEAQEEKVRNTTVDHDTYLQGFQARTEKDRQLVNNLRSTVDQIKATTSFIQTRENYYGADMSAKWNMWESQISQNWRKLAIDSARLAVAKYEAETHRRLSVAQVAHLTQMAKLISSQNVAQEFQNKINEIAENGILLKVFAQGLGSWNQAELTGKESDSYYIRMIGEALKNTLNIGADYIDAVVPF